MILDRFDSVVFLGDETLRHIYSAFNMLLRENIGLGALRQWEMKESERETCRCANQLIRPECLAYSVADSQSVRMNDAGSGHSSSYYCDRKWFKHCNIVNLLTSRRYSSRLHTHRSFSSC